MGANTKTPVTSKPQIFTSAGTFIVPDDSPQYVLYQFGQDTEGKGGSGGGCLGGMKVITLQINHLVE